MGNQWEDPGSMFSGEDVLGQTPPTVTSCGDQGSVIVLRRILIKLFEKLHVLEPTEYEGHDFDFSSYLTYQDYRSIDVFLNSSNCAGLHAAENVLSKFIDDGHLARPRIEFTWLDDSPQLIKRVFDFAPVIVIFVMLYMRSRHSILAAILFSGYVLYYKDKYEETTKEAHIEHSKLVDYCSKPLYEKILHFKYFHTSCDNIHDPQHNKEALPNPVTMAIEYLSELAVKPFPTVMKNLGKGYEQFLNSFPFYSWIFGFIIVIFITLSVFKLVYLIFYDYIMNSSNSQSRPSRRRRGPRKKNITPNTSDEVEYICTTPGIKNTSGENQNSVP